jgi:hypothetical protein
VGTPDALDRDFILFDKDFVLPIFTKPGIAGLERT